MAHVLKLTNCIGFVPVRQEVIYELSLHGYAQNESQLKELFSSFQMLLKHDSYQDMIHYSIKVQEGDINKVKEILIKENLLKNDAEKGHEVEYFVTDGQDKFKEIGIMFLNENIDHVNLIKL